MVAPSGGEQLLVNLVDESCHNPWGLAGGSQEVQRSLGQKLAWGEVVQAMNVASGQFWRDPGPPGGSETSILCMMQMILLSST